MSDRSILYLVPSVLDDNVTKVIPAYIIDAVKTCSVIFAENIRTTRRFLKSLDKDFVIDHFEWHAIHKAEEELIPVFREKIRENKIMAIISEAGCPGVADPGQALIAVAQEMNVQIKPLVGPSSILLALMASGLNGQHFEFTGYLPIDGTERMKAIAEMEADSKKRQCTKIFIETPYRNNQLLETLLKTCKPETRLCVASELTSPSEFIKMMTIGRWRNEKTDFHKKPVIFLIQG